MRSALRRSTLIGLILLRTTATVVAAAQGAPPASFDDAIAQGKVSLNARLRIEQVDQTALRDANALTLRTRLGYTTASFHGWNAMIEGEHIVAADGESYSQTGLNPGGTGRAVVADPETTELNQLWVSGAFGRARVTLGRQRLVLDKARFIGDVGWRQNMQTFDAFALTDKSLGKTTLTYAYLGQINRVFTRRHAQGVWDSDSHLFNASFSGLPAGVVTAYAYLLDFENSAANSCATYGLSFDGSQTLGDGLRLSYRAEVATQSDYRNSPLSYAANYLLMEAGLEIEPGSLALSCEVLGADNNTGFKTPLATLHAWNGWADLFLATPAEGLRDTYARATVRLPQALELLGFFHRYEAARGSTPLGHELDVQLTRKFGKRLTAQAKFADFRPEGTAYPDVRKLWVQLDFAY